jgi:hypothetical protein
MERGAHKAISWSLLLSRADSGSTCNGKKSRKLLKVGGKQRPDSTQVLAAFRDVHKCLEDNRGQCNGRLMY